MAVSNTLRNFDHVPVRGTKPEFEWYAKRGTVSDGLLMRRWLLRAFSRSCSLLEIDIVMSSSLFMFITYYSVMTDTNECD